MYHMLLNHIDEELGFYCDIGSFIFESWTKTFWVSWHVHFCLGLWTRHMDLYKQSFLVQHRIVFYWYANQIAGECYTNAKEYCSYKCSRAGEGLLFLVHENSLANSISCTCVYRFSFNKDNVFWMYLECVMARIAFCLLCLKFVIE